MARIQLGAAQATQAKERRMLLIALALGLLAFVLVFVVITKATGQRIQVLRVRETIPAGTKFARGMFEVMAISGELAQMNKTFLNAQDIAAYDQKPLAVTLQPGELLTLHAFNNAGIIPPTGKHAITVRVHNEEDNLAQMLRPGNAVDIHAWFNGQIHLLRAGACLAAVGDLQVVPTANAVRTFRYRSVTIFVDPDEVVPLRTNLELAGDGVRLTGVGLCDPARERKAAPTLNAQPVPTPTPTPTPRKRRK